MSETIKSIALRLFLFAVPAQPELIPAEVIRSRSGSATVAGVAQR